jgi:type IV pilus assembly protein PilV
MHQPYPRKTQRGISLVEVLVAMVILAIGLLSLVVMQGRIQVLQIEAYQRSQALVLLNDIASRLVLNRNHAIDYVTDMSAPVGVGMGACPTDTSTRQKADIAEWCEALQGASETSGGTNVGAMVGARGCVENPAGDEYRVTVVWQGLSPIAAPPASLLCGQGSYDGGDQCTGDQCRRFVTTVIHIADLTAPAVTP